MFNQWHGGSVTLSGQGENAPVAAGKKNARLAGVSVKAKPGKFKAPRHMEVPTFSVIENH
jgi:hypothetical protein